MLTLSLPRPATTYLKTTRNPAMLCRKKLHEKVEGQSQCKECQSIAYKIRRAKQVKYENCSICKAQREVGKPCGNEASHSELLKWRAKAQWMRDNSVLYRVDQEFATKMQNRSQNSEEKAKL